MGTRGENLLAEFAFLVQIEFSFKKQMHVSVCACCLRSTRQVGVPRERVMGTETSPRLGPTCVPDPIEHTSTGNRNAHTHTHPSDDN